MTEPLLEVRNLRTCFWTEEGVVRAVDGVSFSIDEGERFGLVGESGSGKSVTAATILRLIDPPLGEVLSGQIMFRGTDLLTLSEKELRGVRGGQIAMIFQDPMTALDPVFTIGAQLIETIKLHRDVSDREAREIAIEALADVGIPQPDRRLDDHPHVFSGGMRQRVVIALGLVTEPSLLIADEPTTALDVTTQAQTLDLIRSLVDERGMALLLISHDLGVVAGLCDRMAVMYAGRLVETATVKELFGKPLHPYTAGLLGSIARLDRARDRRLRQIPGSPPSLLALPQGCSFQARCAYATEVCGTHVPMLVDSTPGHAAACHHAGHLEPVESAEPVSVR
ncbi:MAG: ABC transporter ATP-binding protein [Chloroflexota bacterium]